MALIPSGVICMWPSTVASIPSGWSRVTSLDGRHLKGTNTGVEPGIPGGSATHVHTSPSHTHAIASHTHAGITTSAGTPVGQASTTGASTVAHTAHTHTTNASGAITGTAVGVGTVTSASSDPDNFEVIWIQSNGTPTGIPAGAYVYSDDNPLPTGYTLVASSANRFMKGAPTGIGGGALGGSSASHTHTGVTHTHTFGNHAHGDAVATSGPSTTMPSTAGTFAHSTDVHTHPAVTYASPAAGTSSSTASGVTGGTVSEPAWQKLAVVQNTSGSANSALSVICAWLGTLASIPLGWKFCDGANGAPDLRNDFVKGVSALGEINTLGGTVGHDHTDPSTHTHTGSHTHTQTAPASASTLNVTAGVDTGAGEAHIHVDVSGAASVTAIDAQTQTVDTSSDTQPPFTTVAFIQLQDTLDVTITAPTGAVTTHGFTATWVFGGAETQQSYRARVYSDAAGTALVYDSGTVASATKSHTMPSSGYFNNSTTYYLKLSCVDTLGIPGDSAFEDFNTAWTPPTQIAGLTLTPVN